ncbi:MAG: hypothetical protein ACLR0U_16555 [Enterocloster clostridioformis]
MSNNLANVNNTGFKPKSAVFSELINYNLNDSPRGCPPNYRQGRA